MLKTIFTLISLVIYISSAQAQDTPPKNHQVIDTVIMYGAKISPTYHTAVCTELVIKVLEKFKRLSKTDKSRIRIITNKDIKELMSQDSSIPKGVYYALTSNGMGISVDSLKDVRAGDFVQFWTDTWGHCGIVKSIDINSNTMDLYSSSPSTDGYGIQRFLIPDYCFFVRLK